MRTAAVRLIQQHLVAEGFAPGRIDGKLGSTTAAAVDLALRKRDLLPPDSSGWPHRRKAAAYLPLLCSENGIAAGPIDGYWGQQTDYGFESLIYLEELQSLPPVGATSPRP